MDAACGAWAHPPRAASEGEGNQPMVTDEAGVARRTGFFGILPGVGVGSLTVVAVVLALGIHALVERFPQRPEPAILVVGALFALVGALPIGGYLLAQRAAARPWTLAFIATCAVVVCLLASYLYWVSHFVVFPADILIWSEDGFVNDIIKLRLDYPLYTEQQNNESFIYTPGTQILTYALATLLGQPTSIAVFRAIQLGYALLAAVVAASCCWQVVRVSHPAQTAAQSPRILAVLVPVFFLVATNSLTNPFAHNLHNDSLAVLVSAVGFWLLLRYTETREWRVLVAMALLGAIGYIVKQSLAAWFLLYCGYLLVFDRPRSWTRIILFGGGGAVAIGAMFGLCYARWGEPFIYWTITVLKDDGSSPLRSVEHVLQTWPYFAIGLLGGAMLLRGPALRLLLGPWLVWLMLMGIEAYSSGIAWMLNHLGPGSLLASIWFFAALIVGWQRLEASSRASNKPETWLQAIVAVVALALTFSGLGIVRLPWKPFGEDAYRYVREIEAEFQGAPTARILLDLGTWVYLRSGVVMKDRVTTFGDRANGGSGDFSAFRQRLARQEYDKILVRNLHSPDFWYDHALWPRSSGVRELLLASYVEVRCIEAVSGTSPRWVAPYGMEAVSVLVPRRLAAGASLPGATRIDEGGCLPGAAMPRNPTQGATGTWKGSTG